MRDEARRWQRWRWHSSNGMSVSRVFEFRPLLSLYRRFSCLKNIPFVQIFVWLKLLNSVSHVICCIQMCTQCTNFSLLFSKINKKSIPLLNLIRLREAERQQKKRDRLVPSSFRSRSFFFNSYSLLPPLTHWFAFDWSGSVILSFCACVCELFSPFLYNKFSRSFEQTTDFSLDFLRVKYQIFHFICVVISLTFMPLHQNQKQTHIVHNIYFANE